MHNFNYTCRFSSYCAANTQCLSYQNLSLNAVWRRNAVCSEIHTRHEHTVWTNCRIF